MRRTLLAATLIAILLAGCANSPGGAGTTKTSLKVGTEAKYPPFEDLVNGKIVGFDIDMFDEIANRSNFSVSYQNAAFEDIIPSVQSGQFDVGLSAFTINDERKNQVDFSVPYYDNEIMVAVKSDNANVKTEGDLKPGTVRVCTQDGTTSRDWLFDHGYTNDTATLLPDFPTCGQALTRGDVQAIMIDRAAVRDLIAKSNGQIKEAFTITVNEHFGIAVKKGRGDLLAEVNKAVNSMKSDGTLARLMDKWHV